MMTVDFTHVHLLLNHFPIIGTIVALVLLLGSFFATTEDLRRTSLILFVVTAFLAIPAFLTGVGSQLKLAGEGRAMNVLMQRHEGSAELAMCFIGITGALAAIALWRSGRPRRERWRTAAILVCSLLTVGVMLRTGATGREIRHPEVRSGAPPSPIDALAARFEPSPAAVRRLVTGSQWRWAFIMALHFIGLTLLIGTIGLLNLRVLGFAKQLPIAPLNKLVPWGLAGLSINLVTGLLAFIGMPAFPYIYDIAFVLKIVVLLTAVMMLALFYLTGAFRDCEAVGPGGDAPLQAKLIAGTSLALWLAVIVLGRYIAPFQQTISP